VTAYLKYHIYRLFVNGFHRLYYHSAVFKDTFWLGTQVLKCPLDLWIYQEIIHELRPDIIVECGTYQGGSALFLASLCDLVNHGLVLTMDTKEMANRPQHPRIEYLHGSSIDAATVQVVGNRVASKDTVMVILDSDHEKEHVLMELSIYHQFVTPGSYLIVEDTNINGHPVLPKSGPGPMEAVREFLRTNAHFAVDKTKEKFLLTFNPSGYLRRIQ
jgi:cephalosporin hydroxylase